MSSLKLSDNVRPGVTPLTSWTQTPPTLALTNCKKRFEMTAEISTKVRQLVEGGLRRLERMRIF